MTTFDSSVSDGTLGSARSVSLFIPRLVRPAAEPNIGVDLGQPRARDPHARSPSCEETTPWDRRFASRT
jgi:hypothetical protein